MEILIKASQLVLSLSILVVLHEFGHFIPARLFKTRVEKFYLFFNPWFSLVKKKIGETEWGIGWLPLGGYVKIAGMIDESMDKEQMSQPAQPWEFRSKPAWQRLIIMIGGVTVNLILGFLIYTCVVFAYGEEKLHTKDLTSGLAVHPYMEKFGITSGDNILKVEGKVVEHLSDINNGLLLRGARKLTVQHADGKIETITLPADVDYDLFRAGAFPAVTLRGINPSIKAIADDSPLKKAKFKANDKILQINGNVITYQDDIEKVKYKLKGKMANIKVLRGADTLNLMVKVGKDGMLGYTPNATLMDSSKIQTVYHGFFASIGKGFERGMTTLGDYTGQLKFLFTKKGASSIGGFASIGGMFSATWDWEHFWLTTAFISIVLAFMNILPIPALDGGHVVFLLYEIITGKEAPQKVLEVAQYIGFMLLLGLILYANGNDIYRWLFGG